MSNGRASKQDYTNLLFTDSESDSRIPDLKLPTVKGKRQKKKRGGSSGYRSDEASCGLGSLMKVFLLIVLFAVVAALSGISFWSMQKISSLQEKVDRFSEADIKQYKRKKKRRQLDALVDDIKLPRGRKNSSHELLDCQSESSDFDEFSVTARNPSHRKSCFYDIIVVKVVYFILGVTCLSICVGLIWVQWHVRQDLASLKDRVTKVEQSEAFTPDSMTKFQTQLVSLNKSLTKLQSGAGGMKASIEDLKAKVKAFEDTSAELNKAVVNSKEVFDLPKKLEDLTQVVASMNAATINSKQEELENRLSALENDFKTKQPDTETGGVAKPDGQFTEQLKRLNETTIQSIASINNRLDQEESKMAPLEEFINQSAGSSPVASSSLINKMVKDTMQEVMGNLTSHGDLQGLLTQVNGMVKDIQQFKTDEENVVTKGEFLVFKENVMDDLKNVNATLASFNEEFDKVFQLLDSYNSSFIQVIGSKTAKDNDDSVPDASMDESEKRLNHPEEEGEGTSGHQEDEGGETLSLSSTVSPSTEENVAGGFDETIPTEMDAIGDVTEKPEKDVEENASPAPESSDSGHDVDLQNKIKVDNITNMRDLVVAFQKIKPTMEPLNEEELTTLLGGSTVTQELMKAIDKDNDGLFSFTELTELFGFNIPSEGSQA